MENHLHTKLREAVKDALGRKSLILMSGTHPQNNKKTMKVSNL